MSLNASQSPGSVPAPILISDPLNLEGLDEWGLVAKPQSGAPSTRGRVMVGSEDTACEVGVWESTPGTWQLDASQHEFVHVLKGDMRIVANGETIEFHAGDSFFLPAGCKGTQEIITTVRTIYAVIRTSGPSLATEPAT